MLLTYNMYTNNMLTHINSIIDYEHDHQMDVLDMVTMVIWYDMMIKMLGIVQIVCFFLYGKKNHVFF